MPPTGLPVLSPAERTAAECELAAVRPEIDQAQARAEADHTMRVVPIVVGVVVWLWR
jgi:hypothetical protein